jgi:MFS family permease
MSPLLGRMMDRIGPRMVMELGVFLLAAGLLLAPLTTEAWHLYATLGVLVGGGSVCLGYSGQSLFLPNWFVRRRGLATGIAFAGVGVGSIVLLPIGQWVIDGAGWRVACWGLGLLALIVLGPINLLLRKRPEDIGLLPDGQAAPLPNAAASPTNVVDPAWAAVDWTLARALLTARFWWIALGYFCGLYAWYAVQVHQTKYLVEIGFSPTDAAWALGLVSLVGIPGQIALGHVSDRIGREWVWTVSALGFAACYVALLLLQLFPSTALLYAMVIAQGTLGYGLTSVFAAIVAEIFQGRHYGTIFGTLMLSAITGGALGPWATGVLFDTQGDYTLAFSIGIAVSLVSILAIWRAAPREVRVVAGQIGRPPG